MVIIGVVSGFNLIVTLVVLRRVAENERFMATLAGIILGTESIDHVVQYLRSQADHPAGKKRDDG
jgi:hypothetical protein